MGNNSVLIFAPRFPLTCPGSLQTSRKSNTKKYNLILNNLNFIPGRRDLLSEYPANLELIRLMQLGN